MADRIARQYNKYQQRIKVIDAAIKSLGNTMPTKEAILVYLENLDDIWKEYRVYDKEMDGTEDKDDDKFTIANSIKALEDFYYKVKVSLRQLLASHAKPDTTATLKEELLDHQKSFVQQIIELNKTNKPSDIRLPSLQIPNFSGNYCEFHSFKDLYESSVHNNQSVPKIHKFQYLKSLLKDEAAALVRHIPVTEANYDETWQKILIRYDKKNPIMNSFMCMFMQQSSISQANSKNIRQLREISDEVLRGLRVLGPDAAKRDPWLIKILLEQCDSETSELWWSKVDPDNFQTIDNFLEFLNKRADTLEQCTMMTRKISSSRATTSKSNINSLSVVHHWIFKPVANLLRIEDYAITACRMTILSPHVVLISHAIVVVSGIIHRYIWTSLHLETSELLSNNCSNTLQSNASQSNASQSLKSLLPNSTDSNSNLKPSSNPNNNIQPNTSCNTTCMHNMNIQESISPSTNTIQTMTSANRFHQSILPTAVVYIKDNFGTNQLCRILLDSGSQTSFISEACMQKLNLRRRNSKLAISGISSSKTFTKGITTVKLTSRFNPKDEIFCELLILDKLTSQLPTSSFDVTMWDFIRDLQLADPCFNESQPVDIIVGSDHFFTVLTDGRVYSQIGSVIAHNTIFGWVIAGSTLSCDISAGYNEEQSINSLHSGIDIDSTLRRFWEQEEPTAPKLHTPDEELCETHFKSTHYRDSTGRYVVHLAFKNSNIKLGSSLSSATRRLFSIERKFKVNPNLHQDYVKFMREYLSLGHMELVPPREVDDPEHYYIPHHAVLKDSSTTTKVRVVFDASAKTSNSISLNDKMLVGPTIQSDLSALLMGFRLHKIAFVADIEKMYRQIQVDPHYYRYQRILWRENPNLPILHYQLKTITYGTSSAPFLAVRSLHQLSFDAEPQFPIAAPIVREHFYMDDLLSGSDTLENAMIAVKQTIDMLRSGGFALKKWMSNSAELMKIIPEELRESSLMEFIEDTNTIRILGIHWNPTKDQFSFTVKSPSEQIYTKRTMLSEASRIFDPVGWLAPSIILVKLLFQETWIEKLNWHDELPPGIACKWIRLRSQFTEFESISIPRYMPTTGGRFELHGFCDASEMAFAAVVYCRTISSNGDSQVSLITSKTKVAPIKQVSLPRLELCGAHLLATLIKSLLKIFHNHKISIFAWTDATIVLHWLSDYPRRWKTYIANRTSEILDILPRQNWGHVRSADNPADHASRGVLPSELRNLHQWWFGPSWLVKSPEHWPNIELSSNTNMDFKILEERSSPFETLVAVESESDNQDVLLKLFNNISSYMKILRVLSYCRRFIKIICLKNSSCKYQPFLTSAEIVEAEEICLKWAQQSMFPMELKVLKQGNVLPPKSRLLSLTPFLDPVGLIRVGGRLQNSLLSYNVKHPVVLQKDHILSKLISTWYHVKFIHPGPSLLSHLLRQKYWIIDGRRLARKVVNQCIICFRHKTSTNNQLMGQLPNPRVTPANPFTTTGVDFAGPIQLATRAGRGSKLIKGYIAVFVCLCTKAVHLEPVASLTTDDFIAALQRFIARRGVPTVIYSDNGTNFIGAQRRISEIYKLHANTNHINKVSEFLTNSQIQWNFIPPAAPNFGGLWEAAVKSTKHHLTRISYHIHPTFQELSTLLCRIEAILNSRPLCPENNNDVSNLNAITPGHFLILKSPAEIPEQCLENCSLSSLSRWQHIQHQVGTFWKQFQLEYITSLQQKCKWKTTQTNLKTDDLVIIKEDNVLPCKWTLGRVVQTHPGSDGLVRVATIRTSTSTLKRPTSKLCVLPLDD